MPPASKPRFMPGDQTASGLFIAALSLIAFWATRDLELGSLAEIGPGFFPKVTAFLLLVLGAWLAFAGFRAASAEPLLPWSLRPLIFILGGVVLFGLTIRPLGVLVAAPLSLMTAGFASPETKWIELGVFVALLTGFCAVLFRFILGLSIPLAPWLFGY